MDLKTLSWNVQGLSNKEKHIIISQGFIIAKPDLICLQETKLREMNDMFVKDIWGLSSSSWLALLSWGASGGILLIWNKQKLEVLDHELGAFSISIRYKVLRDQRVWVFPGVYGPTLL